MAVTVKKSELMSPFENRAHEHFIGLVQSGATGFYPRKGEKLSNSQVDCLAGVAWVLLSFSPFPVLNPVVYSSQL